MDYVRKSYRDIFDAGWNDKGASVTVPPGFELALYQHGGMGGTKVIYPGQANDDGTLVCQSLGSLAGQMSDSEFYRVDDIDV